MQETGVAHKDNDGLYTIQLTDAAGKTKLYAFSDGSLYKCNRYVNDELCKLMPCGVVYELEGLYKGLNKRIVHIRRPALADGSLEDVLLMPKALWLKRGLQRAGKRK